MRVYVVRCHQPDGRSFVHSVMTTEEKAEELCASINKVRHDQYLALYYEYTLDDTGKI